MLMVTGVVFALGAIQKAPCASRSWVEDREGVSIQCYSDVADLWRNEQLDGGRLPYLDPCEPSALRCDEYPVVSMYVMRLVGWLVPDAGDQYRWFYWLNAAVLLVAALATTFLLEKLAARTLLFAAAPVLAIYGTMNWDLIPVALSTFALVLLLDRHAAASGALLGLGAAAKIYPALLVVPFGLQAQRRGGRGIRLAVAAGLAWLALNLPFAVVATEGWSTFFRYNAERPAEYDSLWRVACHLGACVPTPAINVLGLLLTAGLTVWLWRIRISREPATATWALAFPLLVLFVLTNKVWSPQYALWLLPWFALAAPAFKPFLAWQATEVVVYIARFDFFLDLERGAPSYSFLAFAVVLRAAALLWALAMWARANGEMVPASARDGDLAARAVV